MAVVIITELPYISKIAIVKHIFWYLSTKNALKEKEERVEAWETKKESKALERGIFFFNQNINSYNNTNTLLQIFGPWPLSRWRPRDQKFAKECFIALPLPFLTPFGDSESSTYS